MNDLLDRKTKIELLQTVLAEAAKAKNEITCAKADIAKASNRLNFLVVLANKLIEREKD